jgi:hypothetical protein
MLYTKFTNVVADRIIQPGGPHAVRESEVGNPCSTSSEAVYIALLQGAGVKCSAQHYTNVKKINSLLLTSVKCKAHHCKIPHAELYYSLQASDIRHNIFKYYIQGFTTACRRQI